MAHSHQRARAQRARRARVMGLRQQVLVQHNGSGLYGNDLRRLVGVRGVVAQSLQWQQHPDRYFTYEVVQEAQEEGAEGEEREEEGEQGTLRRGHCYFEYTNALTALVQTHRTRLYDWAERLRRFTIVVPAASSPRPKAHVG